MNVTIPSRKEMKYCRPFASFQNTDNKTIACHDAAGDHDCFLLDLSHPETVEIAVSIDRNGFVVAEEELRLRGIAGLESLALAALFGLYIDPLYEMFSEHGMIDGAYIHFDETVAGRYDRQMLLARGVDGVGYERFHLLAAAYDVDAGVFDHADDVAAVAADVELGFHSVSLLD